MQNTIVTLNGVNIHPFTSAQKLLDYVDQTKGLLVAINAEKILHATDQMRAIINRNIGYCDGAGPMLALRLHGYDDVIEETVSKLNNDYPGIRIINFRNGYIKTDQERQSLIADVAEKKPDVVFVAMGSPKQELLMEEMFSKHPAIYQGLGGSFDVYTGRVKRAPKWWVEHNLEFAYRLINQPSRIKRQIHLVRFLFLVWIGKI